MRYAFELIFIHHDFFFFFLSYGKTQFNRLLKGEWINYYKPYITFVVDTQHHKTLLLLQVNMNGWNQCHGFVAISVASLGGPIPSVQKAVEMFKFKPDSMQSCSLFYFQGSK